MRFCLFCVVLSVIHFADCFVFEVREFGALVNSYRFFFGVVADGSENLREWYRVEDKSYNPGWKLFGFRYRLESVGFV